MSNLRCDWYKPAYWYEVLFVKLPRHLRRGQNLREMLDEELGEGDEFG